MKYPIRHKRRSNYPSYVSPAAALGNRSYCSLNTAHFLTAQAKVISVHMDLVRRQPSHGSDPFLDELNFIIKINTLHSQEDLWILPEFQEITLLNKKVTKITR